MTDQIGAGPATVELEAWLAEQRTHGLIEFAAYPGFDREISHEEAAGVVIAMIKVAEHAPQLDEEI